MLRAVEGVFRNGRVELQETPENIREARVIVTFLAESEHMADQPPQGRTVWERLVKDDDEGLGAPQLHIPPETPPTSAERLHAFESLVASLPEAPAVPLAAPDRENLYP